MFAPKSDRQEHGGPERAAGQKEVFGAAGRRGVLSSLTRDETDREHRREIRKHDGRGDHSRSAVSRCAGQ